MTGNIKAKHILIGGVALYGAWYFFGEQLGFRAEERKQTFQEMIQSFMYKLSGLPTPSEKEEAQIEMSGFTVDTIPQAYTYSAENVPTITSQSPFNHEVRAEDLVSYNALAPGQELTGQTIAQIRTLDIKGFAPCCVPVTMDLPNLNMPLLTGLAGSGRGADLTMIQGKSNQETLDPSVNSDYTNGMFTMALAQWRAEGLIERVSETTVRFVPYDGGVDCMLRRV